MKKIHKFLAVLATILVVPACALAFSGIIYDQPTGSYQAGDDMQASMSLTPATQTAKFKAATFNFLDTNNRSMLNLLENTGNPVVQLGAFSHGNGTNLTITDASQTFSLYAGNELSVQDPATGTKWIDVTPQTQNVAFNGAVALKDQYEVPTTGATVTVAPSTSILTLNPATPLHALTITFPTSPIDGQELKINTTQPIVSLALTAGTTVYGSATSLGFAGHVAYEFSTGDNAWHAE